MGDFFTNPTPSPLKTFSPTVWFLLKVQFLVPVHLADDEQNVSQARRGTQQHLAYLE